jgi:hypothetical protein
VSDEATTKLRLGTFREALRNPSLSRAGLAPDDLARLRTALQRLEECRRLLDGASAARDG